MEKNIESKERPKRRRRYSFGLFNLLFLIVIASFFAISAVVFYVVNRDEDMEWLRVRIESTLNERAGGAFVLTLNSARIAVRDDAGATLHLGGIDLEGRDQSFSITGGDLSIRPNWFSLLTGNIQLNAVTFNDAHIKVRVPNNAPLVRDDFFAGEKLLSEIDNQTIGSIDIFEQFTLEDLAAFDEITQWADKSLSPQEEGGKPEILQLAGEGLSQVGRAFERMRELDLGDVALTNVSVDLVDENNVSLRNIFITSATLDESDAEGDLGVRQTIDVETQQRGEEGVSFSISHIRHAASTKRAFLFDISNFLARNFIQRLNLPDYPVVVAVPFSAKGQVVIEDDAVIDQFRMSVFVDKGFVTTGSNSTFQVDSGALNLSLNRRAQSLTIEPSPFVFGQNKVRAQGEIKLPQRLDDPYHYELIALDSYFDTPDANSAAVVVESMVGRGALQPKQKLVSVSSFKLNAGEIEFAAAVSFGFDKKTPSMALAAEASEMPVGVFKQLWPVFIAPSARRWALANIHSGTVSEGVIRTAIPGEVLGLLRKGANIADDEMQVDFKLTDASFNTFGDFPKINKAEVYGKVRGISFTADLKSGSAQSAYDQPIEIESGQFYIPDFRFSGPTAKINLAVNGNINDVGEIADRQPVRALQYVGVESKGLIGKVSADLDVSVPLRGDLKPGEVVWRAGLDLNNFTSPTPLDGRKIEKADAKIEINPDLMIIKGKGIIDGIAADIDLNRPFDGKSTSGSLAVNVILSDEDRKKLGIDLEAYLSGPISMKIEQKNGSIGDVYKMDLSKAEIKLDFVGWRKAKGVQATAEMRFSTNSKGTTVRNFILKGDGFGASGDIDLTTGGEIKKITLRDVALKRGDDLKVSAILRSERTYDIEIDGRSFDARSLIKVITSTPSDSVVEGDQYRYKIRADIDKVTGYLNEMISDFSLDVTMRSNTPLRLDASGLTKGAAQPFSISYGSKDKRGDVLSAHGTDGGALARFSNIYYRAFGGAFKLLASRPPGATAMKGNFRMNRFWLVEEPALKGLSAAKNSEGKSSVKFDILSINFIEENQRLTTTKGLLTGENVGGTYEGILNRKTKAIDFTGTYVPAYVLNNFITKIPILGLALGNGQREGLIGVTFKVAGTLGKPVVSVNPLSALAPGFLRQFFRFKKAQENTN